MESQAEKVVGMMKKMKLSESEKRALISEVLERDWLGGGVILRRWGRC